MKNIFFILIILFTIINVKAGELSISPDKPTSKHIINLNYKINFQVDSVYAVLYSFNSKSTLPKAIDIKLDATQTQGLYAKSFVLEPSIEFGIFKIVYFNGTKSYEDNNYRNYYNMFIYDSLGKAVKNTYKYAAVCKMGNIGSLNMNPDFSLALDFLKKEVALYPENNQAQIGYIAFLFDLGRIGKTEFESRMREALDKPYNLNDESDIAARVRGLNMLNRKNESELLLEKFAESNPKSSLVEDQIMNKISSADDLYKFAKYADLHLKYFPNSDRHQLIAKAIVNAYLQNAKYGQLMSFLKDHQIESPDILLAIASSVKFDKNILTNLSKEQRSDSALSLYNKCNRLFLDEYYKKEIRKPYFMSKFDYDEGENLKYALIAEEGGNLMYGDNQEAALILYNKALELYNEKAPALLFKKLIDLNKAKENFAQAFILLEKATLNSSFYEDCEKDYIELFSKVNNSSEEIAKTTYNKLLDSARILRLMKLKEQETNSEFRSSYLKTSDEQLLDMAELRGKISILYFMSGWAGPCQAAVPAIEELANLYKDDSKVNFIVVDIWEKDNDKATAIKNFIKEYEIKYPIYYDPTDMLPRSLSINGLPTIVILDEKGTVKFKMAGFNSADDYIRNINDMVDYLIK